jgi:hypothetical protein
MALYLEIGRLGGTSMVRKGSSGTFFPANEGFLVSADALRGRSLLLQKLSPVATHLGERYRVAGASERLSMGDGSAAEGGGAHGLDSQRHDVSP